MKRYLLLCFLLIMTVKLCACGQKDSESAPEVSGTPVAAEEKAETTTTIEIAPPDGWTKMEESVLPVHYMKGTASFMAKAEPFAGTTLDEVVEEALAMYQKSFDNLEVQGEVEEIKVDEKDARKLTFTCSISGMDMKYVYVYVFVGEETYAITFGDQASTFDSIAADYETILSNIHFEE